jgi:uncharacterized membrane protein
MRTVMLIIHLLGMAMSVGTSFAFMFLGMTASKLEGEDRTNFLIRSLTLGKIGNIGLVLLFISGGYLMTPFWRILGETPLLIAKLVLFLAFGAFLGIISSKAKKAGKGDLDQLKPIPLLVQLTVLTGIVIVILAVTFFK